MGDGEAQVCVLGQFDGGVELRGAQASSEWAAAAGEGAEAAGGAADLEAGDELVREFDAIAQATFGFGELDEG